jgi:S-methylmethionine-dependent homocysteine/selenocysteine methylase
MFESHPLVLDGATGTELARRGIDTPLPLWSAGALETAPQVVQAIHRDYILAGADVIVANTFRTNVRTLRAAGRVEAGLDLNRIALTLARQAASADSGRSALVAASVAPVEDCYHPGRVPDEDVLNREHGRMMDWLARAEPDLVWIETMNTLREARAAARAAVASGIPFAVSFVTAQSGDLLSGEPLEHAVAAIEPFEPLAIGLNCIPPEGITANLPRLRRCTDRPTAVYAHLGNPEPIFGWSFSSDVAPAEYAAHVRRWLEMGATIIGGCCGTNAGHIRAIRDEIDRFG